ncbi:DNA-binding protein WhiA [Anaeropeptidivorans aminofermentans]|jgi:hypothetical protein|uniref:DNA-binding protein WhiA n=1 Tax=Anaeropeptidivorans aminofermentans TaxID=2934315 RepID=UPI002023EEA9|nr:DNA-binding protein WhiA [Anaeropeptidivorans aminofermentans]MBE6011529.1 DNA-binding protein WhiA [Lachnospiraceae bacterium]
MSFSNDVKQELSFSEEISPRHCDIAEILGFLNMQSKIIQRYGRYFLYAETDNYYAVRRFCNKLKSVFGLSCEVSLRHNLKLDKKTYYIYISHSSVLLKILKAAGIYNSDGSADQAKLSPLVVKSPCCKRSYLRTVFLTNGSISDPLKSYHLEFVFSDEEKPYEISKLLEAFELSSKIIKRKNNFVLYLKEADNIADLLNIMGAHGSLLDFEGIRVIKDVSNNVNRKVNFETANLNKTISASVLQIEDINFIEEKKGLSYLSEQLLEVALMRLEYPNATLKEIGEKLMPKISKSGVNHRLRKISDIAEKLRRD